MATYTKGKNVKLSTNFDSTEFDCHGSGCCSKTTIDPKLVTYLQQIRTKFKKPVVITSAYRCSKHNKAIGGASGSKHTKGMAADIYVEGVKPATIAKYAESIGIKGIGLYEDNDGNFVHVDTRTTKSFWYGHAQLYRSTFGGAKQKYSGTFPTIKVTYYITDKKGKKVKKTRNYLQKGDTGTAVKNLQKFLNWYVNYKLTTDGDFGAKTEAAVKKFQTAVGVKADGLFGSTSLSKAKKVEK